MLWSFCMGWGWSVFFVSDCFHACLFVCFFYLVLCSLCIWVLFVVSGLLSMVFCLLFGDMGAWAISWLFWVVLVVLVVIWGFGLLFAFCFVWYFYCVVVLFRVFVMLLFGLLLVPWVSVCFALCVVYYLGLGCCLGLMACYLGFWVLFGFV